MKKLLGILFGFLTLIFAPYSSAGTIMVTPESLPSLTFTVTFPDEVCVGQEFTIDYTIEQTGSQQEFVTDWIQVLPDPTVTEGKATFLGSRQSEGTTFDPMAPAQLCLFDSIGKWSINQIVPEEGLFLRTRLVATEEGLIRFTSHILTRPPTAVGPIEISVVNSPFEVNDKMGEVCPGDSITFNALRGNTGCEIKLDSVTQPEFGQVRADFESNTFTYKAAAKRPTPPKDCFCYTLIDAQGTKKTAKVCIDLLKCTPCGDAFEVNPRMGDVCPGESRIFNALRGNSGCDLTLVRVSQPANGGRVEVRGNRFKYTAPRKAPESGKDRFTYTMSAIVEGNVLEEQTAPVTMTILCCDPFEVNPKSGEVCAGDTICFDALAGNSGCNLRLKSVTQGRNGGTVVPNFSNNTFSYTAPAKFPDIPRDKFTYTMVADVVTPKGIVEMEKTACVRITILKCTPCGDAFQVNTKRAEVCPSTSFEFDALEGNSGCDLVLVSITQPINGGRATIDVANNTFTYFAPNDPPPGGVDRFTYTMSADIGDTPTQPNQLMLVTDTMTAPVICTIPCCEEFDVNAKEGTVCNGESIRFDATEGNTGCNLQLVDVTQPVNGGVVVADVVSNSFVYTAPVVVAAPVVVVAAAEAAELAQDPCPPFVPTKDELATDAFTYSVMDGDGQKMRAPVTITIECCEDIEANPKSGQTFPGCCVVFDALEGNKGCLLRLNGVTQPNVGRVVPDFVNNTFTYQAPANAQVPVVANFAYSVVDVVGVPVAAPVAVAVVAAPVVVV